jgi:hypothetical protein
MNSGQVAMLLQLATDTPAGVALIKKVSNAHCPSIKKLGGYLKWMQTSPTSMIGMYLMPSNEAMIAAEFEFQANPDVNLMVSDRSIRMELHFTGAVNQATKAHFNKSWGTVEGYNLHYPENAAGMLNPLGTEQELGDLFAYCGTFEMPTAASMDKYWVDIVDIGSLRAHDHALAQQVYVPLGDRKILMFCLSTKSNYLHLLDFIGARKLIAPGFVDAEIELFTHNGNAEISAALAPWAQNPKLKLVQEVEGSGFNHTGICGFHAKAFFRSSEDAEAACAKFSELVSEGHRQNTCMSGCVAKYGGCGMTFFVLFRDEVAWETLDTYAAGLEGFVETCIEPALHFTGIPFGFMSANWKTQLSRWEDIWNISWQQAGTIDCSAGQAYSASDQSVCGWQEFHFETPENMAAAINVHRTQEVQSAWHKNGVFWSYVKVGISSMINFYAFPSFSSFQGTSDQLGALPQAQLDTLLGAKKISCFMFGDGGNPAGAKAITEKWNALPQYDIRVLTLAGGYP